jgi:hypothetical protein
MAPAPRKCLSAVPPRLLYRTASVCWRVRSPGIPTGRSGECASRLRAPSQVDSMWTGWWGCLSRRRPVRFWDRRTRKRGQGWCRGPERRKVGQPLPWDNARGEWRLALQWVQSGRHGRDANPSWASTCTKKPCARVRVTGLRRLQSLRGRIGRVVLRRSVKRFSMGDVTGRQFRNVPGQITLLVR